MCTTALVLAGCSPDPDVLLTHGAPFPESITSDRDLPRRPWEPVIHDVPGRSGEPDHVDKLTLKDAIGRALNYSAAVKGAFVEIEARHGEEAQASVKPNPELLLEVENFGGSKSKVGFDQAEETLQIAQLIELGDKRLLRLRAAHLDASLAGWDYEVTRLTVASKAAEAFVDVLASQDRLSVLKDFVTIADKTQSAVDARVTGGRASSIDLDRAKVVSARARALVEAEKARLEAARSSLSVLWGSEGPRFERAAGKLDGARAVPSLESVKAYLDANPLLARWSDEIGRRYAQLDVEHSKAIPDIRIGAGVRQFNEDDSTAVVASLSIPLQVFDTNSGNIVAAEQRIAKSEFEQQAARTDLVGSVVEALGALAVAAAQVNALEREVLPAARSAFERTKIGYDEGKFDLLNLLDTQRLLFEARLDLVNAQAESAKARARVEVLIGRDLSGL
jgi:cobalt-zinc-cadmium efflux system outer membrane protein